MCSSLPPGDELNRILSQYHDLSGELCNVIGTPCLEACVAIPAMLACSPKQYGRPATLHTSFLLWASL